MTYVIKSDQDLRILTDAELGELLGTALEFSTELSQYSRLGLIAHNAVDRLMSPLAFKHREPQIVDSIGQPLLTMNCQHKVTVDSNGKTVLMVNLGETSDLRDSEAVSAFVTKAIQEFANTNTPTEGTAEYPKSVIGETPEEMLGGSSIETRAQEIYEGWNKMAGWIPWVKDGNSELQVKARKAAAEEWIAKNQGSIRADTSVNVKQDFKPYSFEGALASGFQGTEEQWYNSLEANGLDRQGNTLAKD